VIFKLYNASAKGCSSPIDNLCLCQPPITTQLLKLIPTDLFWLYFVIHSPAAQDGVVFSNADYDDLQVPKQAMLGELTIQMMV
jgi:hypothetical protein